MPSLYLLKKNPKPMNFANSFQKCVLFIMLLQLLLAVVFIDRSTETMRKASKFGSSKNKKKWKSVKWSARQNEVFFCFGYKLPFAMYITSICQLFSKMLGNWHSMVNFLATCASNDWLVFERSPGSVLKSFIFITLSDTRAT